MANTKEYSLWLTPPTSISEELSAVISQLSQQHSTPYFEPHITLLGDLTLLEEEMLSRTSQLADLITPFKLKLTTVSYLQEYFRCLFIKVEESQEIIEANQKARTLFHRAHDPKFMPHLSLMYGDFSPEKKEKIILEIGNDFHMTFEVRSLELVLSSSHLALESWRTLQQFNFQQDK